MIVIPASLFLLIVGLMLAGEIVLGFLWTSERGQRLRLEREKSVLAKYAPVRDVRGRFQRHDPS